MGVQGLWTLISPVARPVNLEAMGNKKLAIDSSIWLYQFQKAMRDREGKGIVNAHILGFLRRISKLLYYGIKPVFVFDGGVPILKKQTINERKQRKRGVQDNLAKTAEKLLAAQLRQAAVIEAQKRSQVKATGELITQDTVYFDHPIVQDFSEKNSVRRKRLSDPTEQTITPIPSPTKKSRFVPKDQYQLPPIDKIPSLTETDADHRLATEIELKQFIHEFTPEDLDINSPHFQSLSTELKYEIIGDLRIKSRQPNRTRVEAMRKTNDHEFSQTQILNLKKRNNLTQKLLTVTDMVAKANLTIPIKIAAQRNKEYVLVKASEGWILGIENETQQDIGSSKNPVKVDVGSEEEDIDFEKVEIDKPAERVRRDKQLPTDSDDELEFEEVPIPVSPSKPKPNRQQQEDDWRNAIRFHYGTRDPDSVVEVEETSTSKSKDGADLFRHSDEEDDVMRDIISELAAHEASNQSGLAHDLGEGSSKGAKMTTQQSKLSEPPKQLFSTSATATSSKNSQPHIASKEIINDILASVDLEVDDEFLIPPTATPVQETQSVSKVNSIQGLQSNAEDLLVFDTKNDSQHKKPISQEINLQSKEIVPVPDNKMAQVKTLLVSPEPTSHEAGHLANNVTHSKMFFLDSSNNQTRSPASTVPGNEGDARPKGLPTIDESINPSNLRYIPSLPSPETFVPPLPSIDRIPISPSKVPTTEKDSIQLLTSIDSNLKDTPGHDQDVQSTSNTGEVVKAFADQSEEDHLPLQDVDPPRPAGAASSDLANKDARSESPEISIPWSRTPTPDLSIEKDAEAIGSDEEEFNRVIQAEEQAIDTNLALESNEWESFLAGLEDQEKLEGIRQEADSEVQRLKVQKAKDRRDADDVNIQMSQDIQSLLKLFGIPYVVSPMEAEAQCAELLKLGLVDGIITDDSDVFLFGGHRVYKNLFNQNKFVECYLMNDLDQELGLDQQKLIQLAFLLGSDYTDGLNGVGPVTAMEILSEFDPAFSSNKTIQQNPNLSGLLNFKNWWEKVQVGKDNELESGTSFRKKFRKKKDKIWIDDNWPNPAVAEAYLHPTVDHSTEKFVWGLPDLDGIREFLYDHLGWSSIKTDEVIVPLIKRQTQRLNGTVRTQGVLDDFFDYSVETNKASRLAPPRIDSGISSQRLQKIVQNWREKKKRVNKNVGQDETENQHQQQSSSSDEVVVRCVKGRKRANPKPTKPPPKARKIKPKKVTPLQPTSEPSASTPALKSKDLTTPAVKTRSSKRTQSNLSKTNATGKISSSGHEDSDSDLSFDSTSLSIVDQNEDDFQMVKKRTKKKKA